MKAKHTPGPWQVKHFNPTEVCDCDGEVRGCSGIARTSTNSPMAERLANAKLIAAAPDLLASLRECESILRILGYVNGADIAKAAIDKAL